jgi:ADP-heptose:LPS heptosyltransferase
MRILAIRFARLGDVILLLPALASLKRTFPDSELTLLTGHRCAPIAELCPAIDHVIAVDRIAMRDGPVWRAMRDMAGLVRKVRQERFDMVVDFHSFRETNLLTWLSAAPVRIGMKRHKAPYLKFCFNRPAVNEDKGLHVSEMFQKVANAVGPTAEPKYAPALSRVVAEGAKRPTIAMYVDAPVPERIWPAENFAAAADFAIEKLGAGVIVLSSPQGAGLVQRVRSSSRYPERLSVFTDLTLGQLAQKIASADLLVSNDTGPMHIGPAVGVPTLGLFSVGLPEHFKPIGPSDRFLRANPIDQISVRDMIETMAEMWATADRDLRR